MLSVDFVYISLNEWQPGAISKDSTLSECRRSVSGKGAHFRKNKHRQ